MSPPLLLGGVWPLREEPELHAHMSSFPPGASPARRALLSPAFPRRALVGACGLHRSADTTVTLWVLHGLPDRRDKAAYPGIDVTNINLAKRFESPWR